MKIGRGLCGAQQSPGLGGLGVPAPGLVERSPVEAGRTAEVSRLGCHKVVLHFRRSPRSVGRMAGGDDYGDPGPLKACAGPGHQLTRE